MKRIREAGAVAVSLDGAQPRFLLVTAREHPEQWVLPKGHIDPAEDVTAAAMRELREEAGVEGTPVALLGTVSFLSGDEPVNVTYVLVRARDAGRSPEGRALAWLPYADARA